MSTLTEIIDYILKNLKDIINIFFWIITAILGIAAYRNAKKTLFNPIRSEMVKYQMKLITEFIDNHTSKGHNFDNSIDYFNLFKINYETDYLFEILTNEANFEQHEFNEVDEVMAKYCRENLAGLFEISIENKKLVLDFVYGDFEMSKKYIQTKFIKDKELRCQNLFLQRFYINKKFYSLYSDLLSLKSNPFVPEKMKTHIESVISNIYTNIGILYELLSKHISEQTEARYHEIYFQFLEQRVDHEKDLEQLLSRISIYFKVNSI